MQKETTDIVLSSTLRTHWLLQHLRNKMKNMQGVLVETTSKNIEIIGFTSFFFLCGFVLLLVELNSYEKHGRTY